jgi:outer membrane protein TolC
VQKALATRRQLKAATYLQDAARVLARGSRSDLKRRVDFTLTAGMNTLYESPFLRVLGEEQEKPVPYVQGSRFSSPRGYFNSLGRTWKPQVSAQLTFDLPFKNNAARGRFLQDDATFRQAQIQRQDLERTIRDNVTDISHAVARAAEAMQRNKEALGLYETTLANAMERYQAGDITLLDTIVTEEDLTRQRQQYVRSVQTYLSLLARLKFETGDLLQFNDEGSAAETAAFEPSAFIAR